MAKSRPRISEADIHSFHLSHPSSSMPSSSAEPDPLSLVIEQLDEDTINSALAALPAEPDEAGTPKSKPEPKSNVTGAKGTRRAGSSAGTPKEKETKKKARKSKPLDSANDHELNPSSAAPNGVSPDDTTAGGSSANAAFSEEQIIQYHLSHPAPAATSTMFVEIPSVLKRRRRLGSESEVRNEDRPTFSRPLSVLNWQLEPEAQTKKPKSKNANANANAKGKGKGKGRPKVFVRTIDISEDVERAKIPPRAVRLGKTRGCSAAFWLGGLDERSTSTPVRYSSSSRNRNEARPTVPDDSSADEDVAEEEDEIQATPAQPLTSLKSRSKAPAPTKSESNSHGDAQSSSDLTRKSAKSTSKRTRPSTELATTSTSTPNPIPGGTVRTPESQTPKSKSKSNSKSKSKSTPATDQAAVTTHATPTPTPKTGDGKAKSKRLIAMQVQALPPVHAQGDGLVTPPAQKKRRVSEGKRRPKWVTETPR